jgi:hypothetical protein
MSIKVREATRADVAATHWVRLTVRENPLTSMVLSEHDYITAMEVN